MAFFLLWQNGNQKENKDLVVENNPVGKWKINISFFVCRSNMLENKRFVIVKPIYCNEINIVMVELENEDTYVLS